MSGEKSYNQRSSGSKNSISRSRALGVIALMLALFIFQVSVFTVNAVKQARAKKQEQPSFYPDKSVACNPDKRSRKSRPAQLFAFDPNTISLDSLCLLGFSPKQAQTIINYRSKGGKFRKKEDFARMYVVSEERYAQLSSYIFIPTELQQKVIAEDINRQQLEGKPVANRADGVSKNIRSKKMFEEIDGEAGREKEAMESASLLGKGEKKRYAKALVVDLNLADTAQLVKLYGIGSYYAQRIVEYRQRIGGFYAKEQLMEIDGIDSVRYSRLAKNVTADPAQVRRFRLDTAGKYFLMRHPYIGAYAARGIILMREKMGKAACTLENLVKERVLTPKAAERLWYYVDE